jgi:hypothetical protein
MDEFVGGFYQPNLDQDNTNYLDMSESNNEMEAVKNLPSKSDPGPSKYTAKLLKFKRRNNTYNFQSFPRIRKKKNTTTSILGTQDNSDFQVGQRDSRKNNPF